MKKLTLIPVALMACMGAYGQGTIALQNSSSTILTTSTGAAVGISGSKVELFYQADNGGAAPAAISAANASQAASLGWTATQYGVFGITPANSPTFGVFDPGVAILSGITAGNNVWLDLVSWNNGTTQTTLAAAVANAGTAGQLIGFSTVWANGTGGAGSPAGAPAGIIGPTQFNGLQLQPVPEPTTIALGALGAASLLAFRRRK